MRHVIRALVLVVVCAAPLFAEDSAFTWLMRLETDYRIVPNVTYLTVSSFEAKLDLYVPRATTAKPAPTVIFFHGGFWANDSKETRPLSLIPYLEMGMNVVNVEFRTTKTALAPAAVEDGRCAIRWVIQHAKEYAIDPDRLVIAGASSGGHLALATAMPPVSAGLDSQCPGPDLKPVAIINWYGITDVNDLLGGANVRPQASAWIGNGPDRDQLARRVSPITYVRAGLPPIFTVHGDADPTVPYAQAVRLHKALTDAGVPNELYTVPGGKHGPDCCTLTQRTTAYTKIREFLVKNHVLDAAHPASD